MRNVLYKNKLLAMFALVMIALLASREETLVSVSETSYHNSASALNDNGVPSSVARTGTFSSDYTERLQRERIAQINLRIDGYNLDSFENN